LRQHLPGGSFVRWAKRVFVLPTMMRHEMYKNLSGFPGVEALASREAKYLLTKIAILSIIDSL
jgi:hypothetical protein